MVAIVTGTNLGLGLSSQNQLGPQGVLGNPATGLFGENVTVNAANGNLVIDRTDAILIGTGPNDIISTAYNSLSSATGYDSAYGANNGWQTDDGRRVTLFGTVGTSGSYVQYTDATGSIDTYKWVSGDSYQCTQGGSSANTLVYSSTANTWTLTNGQTQEVEVYDGANGGRLKSVTDANGNTLTYGYTGSLLTTITAADGEYLKLTYTGNNLTGVTTYYYANQAAKTSGTYSTLSDVSYTYDSQNRLSTVTTTTSGSNSVTLTYGYQGTTDLVTSISQTGGASLAITYDSSNRVQTLKTTLASGVTNTTSFTYNTGSTSVTDNAGNVTKLTFDSSGDLTNLLLPPAVSGAAQESYTYTYNNDGDVLTAKDALGNVTTYTYDSNDNLLTVADPLGNTTTNTYDSKNHVLTATVTPGTGQAGQTSTTRYVYDTNENLRFAITSDGEVTQYIYNSSGQQTSSIVYMDDAFNLSGYTSSQSPSLSTMTSWASGLSDLANTQRTDTTYDWRGNVSTATTYQAVSSSGSGLTTSPYTVVNYVYNQAGQLLSQQTVGMLNGSATTTLNAEVYTYDGLGRVLTATDMEGGVTTTSYSDSTNTTTQTTPDGLTITSVYNLAGQLLSQAQSGSGVTAGTTSYQYNNLDELSAVKDANGHTSYMLYDNLGRKVADIAADGSITEYQYSADNQVIATVSYATRLTSTQLSSLSSVAAYGTMPSESSVTPTSSSSDVWIWNVYDTDNRLVETINGDGDVVVYAYDDNSNLISTTSYANVLSASTVSGFKTTPPTSLVVPTADPGADNLTRTFYNNEGQVIAVLDGDGYLAQTVYNDAGETIKTLASVTQAASNLWASGTLAQLQASVGTSARDEATYYAYDAQGNLRYLVNPNLTVVEYDYNGADQPTTTIQYAGAIASQSSYTLANIQSAITSGNLASNPANRTSYIIYDTATGNVDFTIDAAGDVTQYSYDAEGNVIKTTNYAVQDSPSSLPLLSAMQSWVSGLSSTQLAASEITRSIYNAAGQLIYALTSQSYGGSSGLDNYYVTQFSYDADGHVTKEIQYASTYAFTDATATLSNIAATLPSSPPSTAAVTTYAYDVDGRVTDTTNALGYDTHVTYDGLGRVATSTVANGTTQSVTTSDTYDNANNLLSVTDASSVGSAVPSTTAATTSYTYDGMGHVLTRKDADGYTTTDTYDAMGNVLTATDPTGAVTTNTYDAFGNVLTTKDGNANTTYFFYDQFNRLVLEIDPLGYATATTYGFGGEIASVTHYATPYTGSITPGVAPTITTSGNDATTSFTRDHLGRVTLETDAVGNTRHCTYDAFGNQLSYTNQLGGVTTYTYDLFNRMISETLPETSTEANGTQEAASVTNTFTYDARSNLTQEVQASGLTEQLITNYTYDLLNHLLTTTETANSGQTFQITASNLSTTTVSSITTATNTYDDRGNLIETVDANGNKTFDYYDGLNRKVAQIDALGDYSAWTYDGNGNVTSAIVYGTTVTLPSSPGGVPPSPNSPTVNRTTSYTYDKDNRILTTTIASVLIGSWNGSSYTTSTSNLTATNIYDADGNLIEAVDADANKTFNYYNKDDQLIATVDPDKYLTTYTLDQNGNATQEYEYANQLTMTPTTSSTVSALTTNAGTSTNDRITNFTYDKNGNRLTETRENVTAYTINATTGALTSANGNSTITYIYNGMGEVLSQEQATGDTTTYTYDSMGRQTKVQQTAYTGSGGTTVLPTTALFYNGLNSVTATAIYDADHLTTSAEVTQYTYGQGGRLATMTTGATGTMSSGGALSGVSTTGAFTRTYGYDANANAIMSSYSRLKSNGSSVTEADVSNYDALNRQILQTVASYSGSAWSFNDEYQTAYDAYGEVVSNSVNGVVQETYAYNNAGQMWELSEDGVYNLYLYDANGNQTLQIASDGNALPSGYSWSTLTTTQAINLLTNNGANTIGAAEVSGLVVTIAAYDNRGQATSTIEPERETAQAYNSSTYLLGTYTTQTITTSKAYDAFGDTVQTTDGNGNVTNYTYSTLGKMLTQVDPSVSYTTQNGSVLNGNPTTTYDYDISGRQIGVKDANGNLTTQSLLANSGYEGSDPLVVKTFDPDGGISINGYDVFGNVITQTNQDNAVTTNTYNALNQLIQVADPVRPANSPGNPTGSPVQLIDYYAYDGLGQRIQSWNSEYGSSDKATTDYDAQGRVVSTVDLAGHATTNSYAWNAALIDTGLGTFGGWTDTTVNSTGLTQTTSTDYAGRTIAMTDFGGQQHVYTFNQAGELASRDDVSLAHYLLASNPGTYGNDDIDTTPSYIYSYYNTGELASTTYTDLPEQYTMAQITEPSERDNYTDEQSQIEYFGYDANGNVLDDNEYYRSYLQQTSTSSPTVSGGVWYQEIATYDAMNWMTSYSDGPQTVLDWTNPVLTYQYDLNGNVRHLNVSYWMYDNEIPGNNGSGMTNLVQDLWYEYDSMNRTVLTDGTFTGSPGSGTIAIGSTGTSMMYDGAGNRISEQDAAGTTTYTYTPDGYLAQVSQGSTTLAKYTMDAMGRVTELLEYSPSNGTQVYESVSSYDQDSETTQTTTYTTQTNGTYITATSTFAYKAYDFGDKLYDGAYEGGVVTDEGTTSSVNGVSQPSTDTAYSYQWWQDALRETTIVFTPDITQPGTTATTTFDYGGTYTPQKKYFGPIQETAINQGQNYEIDIGIGHPAYEVLDSNFDGQIVRDYHSGAPDNHYWYFDGKELGYVSNNGDTSSVDYSTSIGDQTAVQGTGSFQNGSTTPAPWSFYDPSYTSENGLSYQPAQQSYTVQAGDTLQSIAQALWGDSSFWYLIADANGLSANSTLVAGESLIIPNKVHNADNNSGTSAVYNSNQIIGNVVPDAPTVPPPPKHHSGGCGVMGEIILAVVAVVAAVVTAGAALAAVGAADSIGAGIGTVLGGGLLSTSAGVAGGLAIGAGAAAAGSLVSQGVGLATGIQSKLNWAGVGEAAIGAAIGGGIGASTLFGGVNDAVSGALADTFGESVAGDIGDVVEGGLDGIAGSAASQGIEAATGLQKQFNWIDVAGAGVGQGVASGLGNTDLGLSADSESQIDNAVGGMAGVIASAGLNTLANGRDFGDNIISALPNIIGQTIGNEIAGNINSGDQQDGNYPEGSVQVVGNDANADFALAAQQSPQIQAALTPASQQSEGFFGWLGSELEAGANWVENEVGSGFNAVGQALGLTSVSPDTTPSTIETVTVTAQKISDPQLNSIPFSGVPLTYDWIMNNSRPIAAWGGPPNSHNQVTYLYADGSTMVQAGGTVAWRDNNPGNLRSAPDAIGTNMVYSKGNPNGKPMAIFPDVQAGFDAQQRQLFDPNFSSTIGYPNLSIAAAVAKYAPPEDNNPTAVMIQELSTAAGVPSTAIMGTLTPAQQAAFMAEEQRIETSTPGTVESFYWGAAEH